MNRRIEIEKVGTHPRSFGSRIRLDAFCGSEFSHPISHRTPHYRVGNDRIGWMVISQKRLNFGMKRNCTIQDNMAGNGLGNLCPSKKNANLNFEISRRRSAKVTSSALAITTDPSS